MPMVPRTIDEINEKLKKQKAVVVTADEFKRMVRSDKKLDHVDVVTTATMGIMSGTAALLSIPFAVRGRFERAKKVWLNGMLAYPGPCPNERLGMVDVIVYGTAYANSRYGGGHLLRELVEGKEILLKIETTEGEHVETSFTLNDLEFARIMGTRVGFKNYMALVNLKDDKVRTIFSVTSLKGPLKEATVCGCGEINPLQNDPDLRTVGIGTRILVNGARGYVIGSGTRSTAQKPNLSVVADMKGMRPEFMGGFNTSAGPECITSIAVPIPVLDEDILEQLKVMDEDIPLPIGEIHSREVFAEDNYARVWQNSTLAVKFERARCDKLDLLDEPCRVEKLCPLDAFSRQKGIDATRCFYCGACVTFCDGRAFSASLGAVRVEGQEVPIILRQSSRLRALVLAKLLKQRMLEGEFLLSKRVQHLAFE